MQPLKKGIDIIIVSYYSKIKLQRLLESITTSIVQQFFIQVIVVNNAIDEDLSDLHCNYELTILDNPQNRGFGYACNQALVKVKYNYILLLNPDTVLFTNTLQQSFSFLETKNDITVLGVKHVNEHNKTACSCSRFPKLSTLLFDILGLSKINSKLFKPAFIMLDWNHEESRLVNQVMGAYLLIRCSFVHEHGLMDERYFVFLEDTDICKKVWDNNGKVYYNTNITIMHEGGSSTEGVESNKMCYILEGKLKYAYKHFTLWKYFVLLLAVLFVEPFTRIVYSFFNKGHEMKNIVNGYLLFLKRRQFK